VVASIALFAFASVSLADPPDILFDPVPAHQHFIKTPTGEVPAGPQICENPNLQQAFNQFHHNVHDSFIPGVGVIHTLGAQDGSRGCPTVSAPRSSPCEVVRLPNDVEDREGRRATHARALFLQSFRSFSATPSQPPAPSSPKLQTRGLFPFFVDATQPVP
jgi:hypothetical protein